MVQTSTNWCKQIRFPDEKLRTTGKDWKGQANNKSRRSKTLVQKLQDNDIPPTQIVQITWHKILNSINSYS